MGVLVLTHERGVREYAEERIPSLVEFVRERVGFADEDKAEREYRQRLHKELFETTVCVRAAGTSMEMDPSTKVSEALDKLFVSHPLDLAVDDLSSGEEEVEQEHELILDVTSLEKLANAHLGASLWSVPATRETSPDDDRQQAIDALEKRKLELREQLNSGRLNVDDVDAELKAIEERLRELQPLTTRRFFSRLFS